MHRSNEPCDLIGLMRQGREWEAEFVRRVLASVPELRPVLDDAVQMWSIGAESDSVTAFGLLSVSWQWFIAGVDSTASSVRGPRLRLLDALESELSRTDADTTDVIRTTFVESLADLGAADLIALLPSRLGRKVTAEVESNRAVEGVANWRKRARPPFLSFVRRWRGRR